MIIDYLDILYSDFKIKNNSSKVGLKIWGKAIYFLKILYLLYGPDTGIYYPED